MIQVKFKNLEKSELAKHLTEERIEAVISKFTDLSESKIIVTLDMQNSPLQSGPDVFNINLQILNGKYKGVRVTKTNINLYKALADLTDHLLEKLNRTSDKKRVKSRTIARQIARSESIHK